MRKSSRPVRWRPPRGLAWHVFRNVSWYACKFVDLHFGNLVLTSWLTRGVFQNSCVWGLETAVWSGKFNINEYLCKHCFIFSINMYKCKSCLYRSQTLKGYVQHYRLHSNVANITFPCAIEGCVRLFRTYSAFKSHVARDHQSRKVEKFRTLDIGDSVNTLVTQCPFSFCAKISQNLKDLLQHLKSHIMQGNEVLCPFELILLIGCFYWIRNELAFLSFIVFVMRISRSGFLKVMLLVLNKDRMEVDCMWRKMQWYLESGIKESW